MPRFNPIARVYVLLEGMPHEGHDLLGVYVDRAQACQASAAIPLTMSSAWREVHEVDVNAQPRWRTVDESVDARI